MNTAISFNIKCFAMILVIAMMFSFALSFLPVYADEQPSETPGVEDEEGQLLTIKEILAAYLTATYEDRQAKVDTMTLKLTKGDFELYVDELTGEVALKNSVTGQIVLSNPHGIANVASDAIKEEIMSQIIIEFKDLKNNNASRTLYSFTDCASRGQLKVKNIKNGVRIEYTIGQQASRKLVPKWITKDRFESQILNYIESHGDWMRVKSRYALIDPNDPTLPDSVISTYHDQYPVTKKGIAIYVIDSYIVTSEGELNRIEGWVKQYCPHYNYEELEYDHELTQYSGEEMRAAIFKVALEYYIDDNGFRVTCPSNSITFDEDLYQLTDVSILPYLGATCNDYTGYTFIPDGSGTIIRNEDIVADGSGYTVTGQIYGADFAYHKLKFNGKSEVMRMPVYGTIEDTTYTLSEEKLVNIQAKDPETGEFLYDEEGNPVYVQATDPESGELLFDEEGNPVYATKTVIEETEYTVPQGFVAIIEDGEALAEITTTHGGNRLHQYNSVYSSFSPRPTDTYNLADSISIGANAEWSVVSERKYTGKYTLRIIMVSDFEGSKYEGSYVGMAKAYRDHLEETKVLTRIENPEEDIPLYIETFGMTERYGTILSIPVWLDTALTSFEDIKTMTGELADDGITNLNFKLTGYTGGGLTPYPPTTLKFEKVVGGNKGYKDIVKYAKENGIGIFPDFDFANISATKLFDGFRMKAYTCRTIDDRYARKRAYDTTFMDFFYLGSITISPSVYDTIFNKFSAKFNKLGYDGISLGTIGTDLNSDFDEDDPYNREDSKKFTTELLEKMQSNYGKVMINGGNAYTWKYVDHIINASLDGSRYLRSSNSVPFLGIVLHGYISFAGKPTNMVGDIYYEMLKIIENGAAPYFTLSYDNTEILKEDEVMSDYYSIDYKIWYKDLVEKYNTLNEALADVQDSLIDVHKFIEGNRILTEQEAAKEAADYEEAYNEYLELKQEAEDKYNKAVELARRKAEENGEEFVEPDPFEYPEFEYISSNNLVVTDGSIVYMEYDNGVSFVLNYNSFAVSVEIDGVAYTVESVDFVKIPA